MWFRAGTSEFRSSQVHKSYKSHSICTFDMGFRVSMSHKGGPGGTSSFHILGASTAELQSEAVR